MKLKPEPYKATKLLHKSINHLQSEMRKKGYKALFTADRQNPDSLYSHLMERMYRAISHPMENGLPIELETITAIKVDGSYVQCSFSVDYNLRDLVHIKNMTAVAVNPQAREKIVARHTIDIGKGLPAKKDVNQMFLNKPSVKRRAKIKYV